MCVCLKKLRQHVGVKNGDEVGSFVLCVYVRDGAGGEGKS